MNMGNGVIANANNDTKEVENMRRAETVKSLNELKLSESTRRYIAKNFGTIDETIKAGRVAAFEQECKAKPVKVPKWKAELVAALRELELVRPAEDFAMTLKVGRLYAVIFPRYEGAFTTNMEQLTNAQYEDFVSLTDDEVKEVKVSLREGLAAIESLVLSMRFGLKEGCEKTDQVSVGKAVQFSAQYVRIIEARAIRKLKRRNALPAVFDAPMEATSEIEGLRKELEALYKSQPFKRERELLWELNRIGMIPFKYPRRYFSNGDGRTDNTPIDELELCLHSYNCLKRAGINTVADIINLPNDEWFRVRNLSRYSLEEVIERMHAIGYADFKVCHRERRKVEP